MGRMQSTTERTHHLHLTHTHGVECSGSSMCSYAKSWFVFKMILATSFQHLQYVVKHIYAIVFIYEAYYYINYVLKVYCMHLITSRYFKTSAVIMRFFHYILQLSHV